ncbi:MAG: hypothetical protein F6K03_12260 [Kamptonema sp. SIO4C4]|nr:hypothetical protein [Kamptonema sp. SIO4C4]
MLTKSFESYCRISLAREYSILQTLLDYRSLSTRISTFTEGLPTHIHPVTGRMHPDWFQIGARSGRFRCRHPNLQNIPRDKATRSCFTAGEGQVLIKADYSQVELRIMAKVSGDKRMKRAYCRGEDLHRLTAGLVFGKEVESVTEEERRLGKIINFGLIYGMGARKFRYTAAKDYGVQMTMAEASAFRRTFFASYRGIQRYHTQVRREWQKGVRVSRTPDGRRRVWSKGSQPKLNEMVNHPIQGANATITKRALAGFAGKGLAGVRLVAVVHDEILVECPVGVAQAVAKVLEDCMVRAGESVLMPIPCVVDVGVLDSWGG